MKRIDFITLKDMVAKKLQRSGLNKEDANIFADCLVGADVYGVSTHGLSVLPQHLKKIKEGGYNLNPHFKVVRQSATHALIDSDNSIGPIAATYAVNHIINNIDESAIYIVNSFNNNTYGAAFYFPLMLAKKGLIGITFSNTPPQMPVAGGKKRMLGTNPLSIVIPNGEEPIIIDMATSVVAKSKFKERADQGLKLDEGWALDKDGKPTQDPEVGIEGLVLPMAGFKGYGLALVIDIIAGLLSGAAYLDQVGHFYSHDNRKMNVGVTMIAINPRRFNDNFKENIDEYIKHIRSSPKASGHKEIIVPGDDRLKAYSENLKKGIPVSKEIYDLIINQ